MNQASIAGFSAATRAAGAVIVAAYVFGFVPGPVVALVGGLALLTFGRTLAADPWTRARAGIGLALVAGAVGIAALRWQSLDLPTIKGAQAVLGPTVLVGPRGAAAASWLAAAGGMLAFGVWVGSAAGSAYLARAGETLAAGLVLVAGFWGPGVVGAGLVAGPGQWVAVALVTAVVGAFLSWLARRRRALGWIFLGTGAAAVVAAAGLMATAAH